MDSVRAIASLYNEDFQYYKNFRPIKPEEINSWNFKECVCATYEYINTYFNQQRFFDRLEFMTCAKEAVLLLQKHYDIKIVSMGYTPNLIAKRLWLYRYLPGIPFVGVNLKEYKDKSHIDMKDAIFIDDNARNLETSNAKKRYCFGEVKCWNDSWDGKRINDWTDYKILLGKKYRK